MSNIYWCQLLKCEYLLLFFVIYDSYLDILGIYIYILFILLFWTKEDVFMRSWKL